MRKTRMHSRKKDLIEVEKEYIDSIHFLGESLYNITLNNSAKLAAQSLRERISPTKKVIITPTRSHTPYANRALLKYIQSKAHMLNTSTEHCASNISTASNIKLTKKMHKIDYTNIKKLRLQNSRKSCNNESYTPVISNNSRIVIVAPSLVDIYGKTSLRQKSIRSTARSIKKYTGNNTEYSQNTFH